MKSQRLKSIDIFRGSCMTWMILTHLIDWWIKAEYYWLHPLVIMIFDPIGASGFLFISGISISLSYRNRLKRIRFSSDYTFRLMKNSYLLRAFFIFLVALVYNIPTAIALKNPSMIWTWFVLLTSAISLFLAWPLLKTSKFFRISIAVTIIIIHFFIVSWLLPYKGNSNILGVLFHILYNDIHQDPILIFFPFFLVGTVIGDIIYEVINLDNNENQNLTFKKKFLIPTSIIGICLIISGIFLDYPQFLRRESLSWIIYSIGIDITLLSVLISIEKYNLIKTNKSYKFIFYYSYYSLTIYLAHNLLYYLFLGQLNLISIWIFVALSFFSMGFVLKAIYKRWGEKASIKVQVGKLSLAIATRIENRLNNKYRVKVN
ncbi:MAG: acyltransferase family protein [Candidatus Thorarchaeota archaeon]